MKNNKSWRHHYIPQFYLKGFLNDNKTFAVYDKKTDRIKSGEYSTKSHFFEENRNLIEINGIESDILETAVYKDLDDTISQLFQRIRSKGDDFLTFENLFTLKMFISFLYWRIPSKDELLNTVIEKYDFRELGIEITPIKRVEDLDIIAVKKMLKENPAFRKMYSVILPFSPNNTFAIEPHEGEELMWKAIGNNNEGLNLTCDNPIITLRKDLFYGEEQMLLFPVTSQKLLFYGKTSKVDRLPVEFYIHSDLATMHVAERFVCGPNKLYMEKIRELYNIRKYYNQTEKIIPELFDYFK
jgi:hypothetical protein